MCVSAAITSVDLLDGVEHVRVDRFKKQVVVRFDEGAASEKEIRGRIVGAGVSVGE